LEIKKEKFKPSTGNHLKDWKTSTVLSSSFLSSIGVIYLGFLEKITRGAKAQ